MKYNGELKIQEGNKSRSRQDGEKEGGKINEGEEVMKQEMKRKQRENTRKINY